MTLSQAREAHADALALVKQGIDPRYARKTEKQQNEQMPIFHNYEKTGWHSVKPINPLGRVLWLIMRNISPPSGERFRFSTRLRPVQSLHL